MKVRTLIDEVANDADEFLAAVDNRKEAREIISDYVDRQHPELSRKEHGEVVNGVLEVLDEEGFFGADSAALSWSEKTDEDVDER